MNPEASGERSESAIVTSTIELLNADRTETLAVFEGDLRTALTPKERKEANLTVIDVMERYSTIREGLDGMGNTVLGIPVSSKPVTYRETMLWLIQRINETNDNLSLEARTSADEKFLGTLGETVDQSDIQQRMNTLQVQQRRLTDAMQLLRTQNPIYSRMMDRGLERFAKTGRTALSPIFDFTDSVKSKISDLK